MKGYLYETHLHTSEASACGEVNGADYISFMKSKGYSGMIVTDHFFNGNSAVKRDLPWSERVAIYVSGFKAAEFAAKDKDFDVLFGIEFNFEGDEYLIYGVDEKWLLDNDDILSLTRREVYLRVHEAGGIMIQAHPYRERYYLSDIRLTPDVSDGIEVYNAANSDNQNALALRYAQELNVPITSGSDIHYFHGRPMGGMMLPRRIKSSAEYAKLVMSGEAIPVKVTSEQVISILDMPELEAPADAPTVPVLRF